MPALASKDDSDSENSLFEPNLIEPGGEGLTLPDGLNVESLTDDSMSENENEASTITVDGVDEDMDAFLYPPPMTFACCILKQHPHLGWISWYQSQHPSSEVCGWSCPE